MRRFYIFNVRSELQNLYKENFDSLYKILNSLYNMSSDELSYGYNLFKQICTKIDTLAINNKLYLKMHNDLVYTKIDNEHVINNLYKDEVSVLKVKKSHMVLDCNTSYSSFLVYFVTLDVISLSVILEQETISFYRILNWFLIDKILKNVIELW